MLTYERRVRGSELQVVVLINLPPPSCPRSMLIESNWAFSLSSALTLYFAWVCMQNVKLDEKGGPVCDTNVVWWLCCALSTYQSSCPNVSILETLGTSTFMKTWLLVQSICDSNWLVLWIIKMQILINSLKQVALELRCFVIFEVNLSILHKVN